MLLAVDTSTRNMGIALYDGVTVLSEAAWTSQFHHTVELAPAVQQALRRANAQPNDLRCLAVACGPGSFTSLRTGMSFVKGMALARRLPVVTVPSLDILAAAQPLFSSSAGSSSRQQVSLAAVLEVGRGRLAVGWYQQVENAWQPKPGGLEMLTPQQLSDRIQQPTWICGELDETARQVVGRKWKNAMLASPAQGRRQPAFLAELAWQRWQSWLAQAKEKLPAPAEERPSEPAPGAVFVDVFAPEQLPALAPIYLSETPAG